LWKGHLAKGKIQILAGMPGVSKTTLAMSLAATISKGTPLPDGTVCDIGNVLVWSGEDDPKDTLVPRLMANDADLDRIFFVEGTKDESGNQLPFDMSRDVARLAAVAGAVGDISLMVVDPIVSAITGDGNSNSDVRKSLQPLVDLASRLDCAVWGISHFTKNSGGQAAVNRVSGSVAFGAVARLVHICSRQKAKEGEPPPDGEFCIMRAKSNISATGGGFSYDIAQVLVPSKNHIIEASRIEWRGPLSGTAEEVLASFEAEEKDTGALGEAKNFLEIQLSNGPKKYVDILAEAKHESISESTLKRASTVLGVNKDLWGKGKGSMSWWNWDENWPADWETQKQAWEKAKNA
jgi:putative DNA primase/helicase